MIEAWLCSLGEMFGLSVCLARVVSAPAGCAARLSSYAQKYRGRLRKTFLFGYSTAILSVKGNHFVFWRAQKARCPNACLPWLASPTSSRRMMSSFPTRHRDTNDSAHLYTLIWSSTFTINTVPAIVANTNLYPRSFLPKPRWVGGSTSSIRAQYVQPVPFILHHKPQSGGEHDILDWIDCSSLHGMAAKSSADCDSASSMGAARRYAAIIRQTEAQ